ncbi:hypothetical protein EPUS_05400 [Endocarpon pusillum Z07020]|uniref:Uncharacterized protein n=1 Tax=Endocarpon pusillum (strain Z07020 / HMAS-L-300199) TaxID=1263415 RepID=U1GCS6_ENDPU|nr:uncharacterized protein EPUS_05400 [Endocarpon pusillum Z07020]ERF69858.1 hypothetical protein EPUS_05400 [Endocarpon pusillum Z07020]
MTTIHHVSGFLISLSLPSSLPTVSPFRNTVIAGWIMAASFLRPSTFGPKDEDYLKSRFSNYGRPVQLAALWLLDVQELRKINELIIHGSDKTVMSFKESQTSAVGMVAVALVKSAIVSQLSSTTLQIPALSNINWTASAFIIAALLFSILATMLACLQRQILGALNQPKGVRMWLSNGSANCLHSKNGGRSSSRGRSGELGGLQTSIASLLLLRLPNAFLLSGVMCFLIGFGLFLGFAWRQDLDNTPSRDSNRAVMIMYIVVGCVTFFATGGLVKWKMSEVDQVEKVVGKDIEEGDDVEEAESSSGQDEDNESEGEGEALLGKKKNDGTCSQKEVSHHIRIAEALEDAARAHRHLAKLMRNDNQENEDS